MNPAPNLLRNQLHDPFYLRAFGSFAEKQVSQISSEYQSFYSDYLHDLTVVVDHMRDHKSVLSITSGKQLEHYIEKTIKIRMTHSSTTPWRAFGSRFIGLLGLKFDDTSIKEFGLKTQVDDLSYIYQKKAMLNHYDIQWRERPEIGLIDRIYSGTLNNSPGVDCATLGHKILSPKYETGVCRIGCLEDSLEYSHFLNKSLGYFLTTVTNHFVENILELQIKK